jgi:hypothetical protein
MSVADLGFHGALAAGTAGVGAYQPLAGLINQFAPGRFRNTVNTESPTIGTKGVMERVPAKGSELIIYAAAGTQSSTTWIRDFDPLPKGTSMTPFKGTVQPSSVMQVLRIGREAWDSTVDDGELVKLFSRTLQLAAEDAGRHVGRGIFASVGANPQAGATWSGTAANDTVTVPFLDVTMFRPGMAVDFLDISGPASFVVRVVSVARAAVGAASANVAGNVVFINDIISPVTGAVIALTNTTVATGDSFRLRGNVAGFGAASVTPRTGNPLISFDDIAGSGAALALHGIDPANLPGWVGALQTVAVAYAQENVAAFAMRMKSDGAKWFTHVIMSPQLGAAHAASGQSVGTAFGVTGALSAARPMTLEQSYDKYGALGEDSGMRLLGRPIIIDPNCNATDIVLHCNEVTKLAIWKELQPEQEAGSPLFVDRDLNTYSSQISGRMQLFTDDRKSTGIMRGWTGL